MSFPSFISKNSGEIPILITFLGKKFNFGVNLTVNL